MIDVLLLGDNMKTDKIDKEVSQEYELTIEHLKEFVPNEGQIEAAAEVFINMAWVETVKPIVKGYQIKVLEGLQIPLSKYDKRIITNPDRSYLMSNKDFDTYARLTNEARIKAGLKVDNPDFCPLLVAESDLIDVQTTFIKTMEPLTHIKKNDLLCCKNGLERYKQYLDMMLTLISHHVDFKAVV